MISVDYNEYKKTIAENMELIVENHKLQQRIDKALELIYKNAYSEDRKELVDELWYEIPELVAILKGEDKE